MTNAAVVTPLDHSSELDYPFGEPLAAGMAREIAPGILWLRMPLPLTLNHINLWAVRDGDGWAAFDCGMETGETEAAWRKHFDTGGALADERLTRVFVTHMHPDHVGMAGWLTRRFDCRLWMTRLEYLTCRILVAETGRETPSDGLNFYHAAGWDNKAIEIHRARIADFELPTHVLPPSYRRLRDNQLLSIGEHEWRVVVGNGHSPEHACFHCPELKLLISGDQVLPRISSNISVYPTEPDANPMADWMSSLEKLRREIPDDVLVLPAHNEPFRGLHARIDHLKQKHLQALDRLRQALYEPKRAMDVFTELYGRTLAPRPNLLGMATGESIAHLNYLLHRDEIRREIDADGVTWYRMK